MTKQVSGVYEFTMVFVRCVRGRENEASQVGMLARGRRQESAAARQVWSWSFREVELLLRHQLDAPILSAALGRLVGRDEVGLAIAVRNQLGRRDSGFHQVVHDRVCTPI